MKSICNNMQKLSKGHKISIVLLIYLVTMLLLTGLFALYAGAEEELKGILTIDFASSTAIYTEHHEWADTEMTVTVRKSELQSCLDYATEDDCCKYFNLCLQK